jgi:hypothetical protein
MAFQSPPSGKEGSKREEARMPQGRERTKEQLKAAISRRGG